MKPEAEEIFENCLSLDDKPIDLPSSAGLVLFADSLDRPIALLTAANIKRVAKTKLAEKIEPFGSAQGRPTKRADLKSITAKIYYSPCRCKFRLAVKYFDAVKKIFSQNYKDHITLVLPWFIKIDLNEKIPFFSVTKKPTFKNNEKTLGLFPGQKSAITFLKTLEDALGLCRKCEPIRQAQGGQTLSVALSTKTKRQACSFTPKQIHGIASVVGKEPILLILYSTASRATHTKRLTKQKNFYSIYQQKQ